MGPYKHQMNCTSSDLLATLAPVRVKTELNYDVVARNAEAVSSGGYLFRFALQRIDTTLRVQTWLISAAFISSRLLELETIFAHFLQTDSYVPFLLMRCRKFS